MPAWEHLPVITRVRTLSWVIFHASWRSSQLLLWMEQMGPGGLCAHHGEGHWQVVGPLRQSHYGGRQGDGCFSVTRGHWQEDYSLLKRANLWKKLSLYGVVSHISTRPKSCSCPIPQDERGAISSARYQSRPVWWYRIFLCRVGKLKEHTPPVCFPFILTPLPHNTSDVRRVGFPTSRNPLTPAGHPTF